MERFFETITGHFCTRLIFGVHLLDTLIYRAWSDDEINQLL